MYNFRDRHWESRPIYSIFPDIQRGKRLKNADHISGMRPYISSSSTRNGIDDFVGNEFGVRLFHNCLTLANSGSVGTTFFHPYTFVASDHVTKLYSHGMSKYAYLFLAVLVNKIASKYGFNREINDARIMHERIYIPITIEGHPDFGFMDAYMRQVERKMLTCYSVIGLRRHEYKSGISTYDTVHWGSFMVSDLFRVDPGERLESYNMKAGRRPFIGASDANNGITNFLSNDNKSKDHNVLGVNYNGSVCEAFYHPYEALFSDDVKRFHLRDIPDDKYVFLFLKVAILRLKEKFMYGYKFNEERMNRQRLMLPTTAYGKPDYDFMRKFMQNAEAKILRRYAEARLKDIGE